MPAGEFHARRFTRSSDTETSDWWLHKELQIPVQGRILGGTEYVLSRLEVRTPAPQPEPGAAKEVGGF